MKIELVERLVSAGLTAIEITSFVRADRIPQLADAAEVARGVQRAAGVRYMALAPNVRGLETALRVRHRRGGRHHRRERDLQPAQCQQERVRKPGRRSPGGRGRSFEWRADVRPDVSTVAGCPYEGQVSVDSVVALAGRLVDLGCDEISLGDTIGVGRPAQIAALIERVAAVSTLSQLAFHGHDTYGMGVANALAAIDAGVGAIDSSVGGLGGCPFAGPQAKGNLATEDLVYALQGTPNDTGIDLEALCDISQWMAGYLGHPPASSVARACWTRSNDAE